MTDEDEPLPDPGHERAHAVVEAWDRQGRLDAVRIRVGVLALAGLVLFFGRSFVATDGLTELLVQAWVLVSLPVTAATTSLYLTLRALDRPEDLLDREGTVALVAVWVLARLAAGREESTFGRVAWRLVLNHPPELPGQSLDRETDPTVERAVTYVQSTIAASVVVVLADQAWKRAGRIGDVSVPAVGQPTLTTTGSVALVGGAVLLGALVGFLLAVNQG